MSGGSGGGTRTTVQELNPTEREPIRRLYDAAENVYRENMPYEFYPDISVAPPSNTSINAEADALRFYGDQGRNLTNLGSDALARSFRSPYEVFNDPGLQGSLQTAIRPIEDMLQSNLGRITSAANKTGNLGGTRQGVVESLAFNKARDTATDAFNKLYGGAFNNMVKTQGFNLANLGQIQQGLGYPFSLQSQIGDIETGRVQDIINDRIARYQFEQDAPYQGLVSLANIINTNRLPTTAIATGDDMQQGGGRGANALAGATIGNMLLPGGGGAAIGGSIGYFS